MSAVKIARGLSKTELLNILFYTGKVVLWLGALMVIPAVVAVIFREWAPFFDFLIGIGLSLCVGLIFVLAGRPVERGLTWTQGFAVASFSWIVAMFLAAVPYYLSGHWNAYLDALFDVMSGFTTTGVVLVQDLDHIAVSVNAWRHLLTYVGGQGMVVLALTVLSRGLPGAFKLYVGEAKDERLMPSVGETAKAIWFISVIYLIIGTLVLSVSAMAIGIDPVRALLHGAFVFMGAWSTGGFAPQSQNIAYYHSFLFEAATVPFLIAGSLNFGLHYAIWNGRRREILKNIETQVFATVLTILTLVGLGATIVSRTYDGPLALARRVVYQFISAQTTTGFATIYPAQFANEWPVLAILAISISMLFGASASSTAGGFKGVRVGMVVKSLKHEVRKLMSPESAVVVEKMHMGEDIVLEDRNVKLASLIILLYLVIFTAGVLVGVAYGYPLPQAIFESASVTGNVGLSSGVTAPSMPWPMKVLYIFMMWIARLEFMSVLVLFGLIFKLTKK